MTEAEEWRPVVGYEGFYEVSNIGRVRSITRTLPDGRTFQGRLHRILLMTSGYPYAQLCRNSQYKKASVHSLVAAAFIGPCPPGKEVNHKDGNKQNNWADNLEYLTHSENVRHSIRLGRKRNPLWKVKPEDVPLIREMAATRLYAEVAVQFGISEDHVGAILRRERWAMV